MHKIDVLDDVKFWERGAHAEPLLVDDRGRILRFALMPGQSIREHRTPGTPLYILVLQGNGVFTDGEGTEVEVGPHSLLMFDPGESHSVRAKDEPFVFLAFLDPAASVPEGKRGGLVGRESGER